MPWEFVDGGEQFLRLCREEGGVQVLRVEEPTEHFLRVVQHVLPRRSFLRETDSWRLESALSLGWKTRSIEWKRCQRAALRVVVSPCERRQKSI
mmetsp:Transcript_31241/g.57937  ORF Transcript_31241/g.57937 Transcript_31241/m.57937 type:complete len:94 (-) Transcript_31241:42-323(-)